MPRRYLGWILLAALTGASGVVRAQAKTGDNAAQASQRVAEKRRLKAQLERVNAEIDALKRDSRSLRDDYLLRNRMADAEALARQLTALDAQSPATDAKGQRTAAATTTLPPIPEASPADDRAVLEAKADILTDQARRLNSQADILAGRVGDLRARNELRQRAGQLERDPFSALEQAKRRLTNAAGATAPTAQGTTNGSGTTVSGGAPSSGHENDQAKTTGPDTSTGSAVGANTQGVATTAGSGPSPTLSVTSTSTSTSSSGSKTQPSLVPAAPGNDNPGSMALQFRGILDAATLAEIRRLESTGAVGGSLSAMEHALAALRARAAQLATKASALRASANTAP